MRHLQKRSRKTGLAILTGVLVVGGAALLGAHSSTTSWGHGHWASSANMCA